MFDGEQTNTPELTCECDIIAIKMEAAIEIVMKFCEPDVNRYGICVNQHPNDWNKACTEEKLELSRCSREHPAVRKITLNCGQHLSAYNQCVDDNPTSVINCVDTLKVFLQCADFISNKMPTT